MDASIVGTPFSKISLDAFGIIKAVRVDGSVLLDNSSLLAFASPNLDLKFFNPGDLLGGETGFKPVLYTGNGGTQEIKTGFSPDLVWIKRRDVQENHNLYDTIRGNNLRIISNTTDAEQNVSFEFEPSGFNPIAQNDSGSDYVAWCWDAGDTTVANTDGTIASQVRSNGNFSVVKYTATGNVGNIGHGLSSAPQMILVKKLTPAAWNVYHASLGATQALELDDNRVAFTAPSWGDTSPDSSVFTVGAYADTNNNDSGEYIAYCWAETPGVSSFGSYSGTGTNTGPVINC